MPASTIVPPVPTVNQGQPIEPADTSPGLASLQEAFDKVAPDPRRLPKSQEKPTEPQKPVETPKPDVPPSEKPTEPLEQVSEQKTDEHKLPSFLEDVLKPEAVKPEPKAEDEWPEELPTFKSSDEAKERYKKWRNAHDNLKKELKVLKERPVQDEATQVKVQNLERQNKEMQEVLSRMGIEKHVDFQNNIIRPMQMSWQEAARIVNDAGGDPNELAKALSLTGKAQFEALDSIYENMPESAKMEAQRHISDWRRLNDARIQALQNAPKTMEELHKRDLERQNQLLESQRQEMRSAFDEALRVLEEDAKVELLQESSDPETAWWNDQKKSIIENARDLAFKNTDMKKVMLASILANMVDPYRKLWMSEREAHNKTKKLVKDRFAAEPSLTESGGGNGTPQSQLQNDLKRPFKDVFLETFHKAQARSR